MLAQLTEFLKYSSISPSLPSSLLSLSIFLSLPHLPPPSKSRVNWS